MINNDNNNVNYSQYYLRNLIAFWIFGLCNNFGYVVMLSAAEDIINKGSNKTIENDVCIEKVEDIKCLQISTGALLLADIIPSFIIKLIAPFFLNSISYTVRHGFVIFFQCFSFLIVGLSSNLKVDLIGIIFASIGSGLGEVTYLTLSSHFHSDVVSSWSSGTGGAGLIGALVFAVLTDRRFLSLNPSSALLLMLIVPLILLFTFWKVLIFSSTINFSNEESSLLTNETEESSFLTNETEESSFLTNETEESSLLLSNNNLNDDNLSLEQTTLNDINQNNNKIFKAIKKKFLIIQPLIKYMIPLFIVFYAEYFINQGLLELLTFTCVKSFNLSASSQYRWYQVLYQLGVFISRSSINLFSLNASFMPLLALLQLINAALLYTNTINTFFNHIIIIFIITFYEGLIGGLIYVNTFNILHKTIKIHREFSMGFVTLADSIGIVFAAITSIWAHNHICLKRKNL